MRILSNSVQALYSDNLLPVIKAERFVSNDRDNHGFGRISSGTRNALILQPIFATNRAPNDGGRAQTGLIFQDVIGDYQYDYVAQAIG